MSEYGVKSTGLSGRAYKTIYGLNDDEAIERAGVSILDVGAGFSSLVANLRHNGVDAYALDPKYAREDDPFEADAEYFIRTDGSKSAGLKASAELALREFRAHRAIEPDRYIGETIQDTAFPDDSFALVVSSFAALGQSLEDEAATRTDLDCLLRVAKPGGRIATTPFLITSEFADFIKSVDSRPPSDANEVKEARRRPLGANLGLDVWEDLPQPQNLIGRLQECRDAGKIEDVVTKTVGSPVGWYVFDVGVISVSE